MTHRIAVLGSLILLIKMFHGIGPLANDLKEISDIAVLNAATAPLKTLTSGNEYLQGLCLTSS